MSLLRVLKAVLPSPSLPQEIPSESEWTAASVKIGPLPQDYHAFIDTYGSGIVDGFISVFNPASKNEYVNLFKQIETQLNVLRELDAGGTELIPYKLFPDANGLLPFASTTNGDICYWLTKGSF